VSVEAVVRADPDLIIAGDAGAFGMWRRMRARAGGFVTVDADVMHRHTARMIMGVGEVCESIDRARRLNATVDDAAAVSGD